MKGTAILLLCVAGLAGAKPRENEVNAAGDVIRVPLSDEAATTCAKPDSDGVLLAHENCDHFYKCFQGVPAAIPCPDGLLYNIDAQYCDWSYNVNCEDRKVSEDNSGSNSDSESNENSNEDGDSSGSDSQEHNDEDGDSSGSDGQGHSNPSEAPALCAADGSDGILVAHEKCDQFYKCYQGKPVAIPCPAGLLYQPALEYCDWPQNVDCGNRS